MVDYSISIIRLRNILLVTVPPDPNDDMISQLQDSILNKIYKRPVKGVILDLTTVDIVDSYFARVIADTTKMVRLMGGNIVITGMQPNVAITTTQLGLELGESYTTLDTDQAFDFLEKLDKIM